MRIVINRFPYRRQFQSAVLGTFVTKRTIEFQANGTLSQKRNSRESLSSSLA